MAVIELHAYIMKCDRCGKKQEFRSEGKLMHNYIPKQRLPKGWHYISVPDMGFDPYMKQDFETTREILVCDRCK